MTHDTSSVFNWSFPPRGNGQAIHCVWLAGNGIVDSGGNLWRFIPHASRSSGWRTGGIIRKCWYDYCDTRLKPYRHIVDTAAHAHTSKADHVTPNCRLFFVLSWAINWIRFFGPLVTTVAAPFSPSLDYANDIKYYQRTFSGILTLLSICGEKIPRFNPLFEQSIKNNIKIKISIHRSANRLWTNEIDWIYIWPLPQLTVIHAFG